MQNHQNHPQCFRNGRNFARKWCITL